MNYPPFSVAMSVYYKDRYDFLDRALKSITEEQTIMPSEIVLVCDGHLNDELDGVIEKYQSKYPIFNIIRLPENKGLGNALRIAVEQSSYELIARMDSDDISITDRFEQQLSFFINHPDIDVVGGDISEFVDSEINIVSNRCVPQKDDEIKRYMRNRCAMNHVSVMFKKDSVMEAGGYLDWFWNEDYYLWIRMWIDKYTFANTGTFLVNVRSGMDQFGRRGGWRYYKSEKDLQYLMLKNKLISPIRYFRNCFARFIIQVLLINKCRAFVFSHFLRKKIR